MAWHIDPRGQMRRARNEFGAWLSLPPWNWYTTHTFKTEPCPSVFKTREAFPSDKGSYVSPGQADKAWYSWFNGLRVSAKAKGLTPSVWGKEAPFYFRVAEYQDRGTLHYHALIGGVGDIRRLLFKDMWESHGYARVEAYESGKGANFYVGKYLTKGEGVGDIRFSHNLTPYLEGVKANG